MTTLTSAQTSKTLALGLLTGLGLSFSAQAQEVGNVLSRTPVYQQVSVPRQVCTQTQVSVPGQTSGAGALMGAVAGGAIGNAVGKGAEFKADETVVAMGFGRQLLNALRIVVEQGQGERSSQWKDRLITAHPPARTRIARIDAQLRQMPRGKHR